MISKASILAMAAAIGMDKKAVEAAYDAADDTEVEVPKDIVVLTTEGKSKLEREKYEDGKTAGVELAVKEYKQANNLKFTGKDITSLADAIRAEGDVDGKVKRLQANLSEQEAKYGELQAKFDAMGTRSAVLEAIPHTYGGLTKSELMAVAEANGYSFKNENGTLATYKNGQRVRNERTQEDMAAGEVLTNFFEKERKMTVPGAEPEQRRGRGEGGSGVKTGTFKNSDILREFQEKHPGASVNGQDYASFYAGKVKEAAAAGQTITTD